MMNKQDILKKIGNILSELNEQHQYLSSTSKINILELELFTANADFLIDHIEILKKINSQVTEIAVPPIQAIQEREEAPIYAPQEKAVEVVILEKAPEKHTEIIEDKFDDDAVANESFDKIEEVKEEVKAPLFKFDFEEPTEMVFDFEKKVAVENVFDRELTLEEHDLIENKKKELLTNQSAEVIKEEVEEKSFENETIEEEPFVITKQEVSKPVVELEAREPEPIISVISESFNLDKIKEEEILKSEKVPSLNEIFSGKVEQQNHKNLMPITDLKASISLNDKMFFIKELFNGYNLAYSEAIEILNRFDSFEAADNFLMKNYAEKNNWAAKQNTVDRLYEILNRKFKS